MALLVPPSDRFYADPCLWTHQGQNYLFLEEYPFHTCKGVISCLRLDNSGRPDHAHGVRLVPLAQTEDHVSRRGSRGR